MGYFIGGLNGACDPKVDYWTSVKYNKLSCVLDDAYGIIDAFDLRWIKEAGLLPRTTSSVTEEEERQANNLIKSYTILKEAKYVRIWKNNLQALADADDVEAICHDIIEKDKEEERLAKIKSEKESAIAQEKWDSLTDEEKTLAEEIYQWEQSHWANAFEYEDSPYLKMPEFIEKYNLAYDWMKDNILSESW